MRVRLGESQSMTCKKQTTGTTPIQKMKARQRPVQTNLTRRHRADKEREGASDIERIKSEKEPVSFLGKEVSYGVRA